MLKPINFLYGHPRGGARGDAPPLPDDHPQRGGRARQDRPGARGGGGERGRARLDESSGRITLPLTTPGYVAGALLVFIWTFSDFATPLVLGVQDLLAPQAYLNIVQFVDRRIFRMGIVISALMVVLAVVFLLAARRYVAIKDYSSLSYSEDRAPAALAGPARRGRRVPARFLMLLSFIPYVGVALAVGAGRAGRSRRSRCAYTLQLLRAGDRGDAEVHREQLSLLRARGGAVHRGGRAHRVDTRRARTMPGRGALDALNTLILAVPGTAIGIAYIRAFHFDLPGFDRGLTSFWIVMPLVLAVRRLPYTVRGVIRLAPARAPLHGGGGGERGRLGSARLPRRDLAADLEGRPGGRPLLLHDLAAGGLRGALPRPRGLGDRSPTASSPSTSRAAPTRRPPSASS